MAFDPENPEHRKWYKEFTVKRSWGHCPVRFMAESLTTDLVSHVNQLMLAWYVKEEFKNVRKAKTKNPKKPKSKSSGASSAVRRKQPVPAKTNEI